MHTNKTIVIIWSYTIMRVSCLDMSRLRKCLNQHSLCQRLGLTRLWEIIHEREARVSSVKGARVRRRRKTSEASLSPEAQEVLRSKTESLNIHIFLCADWRVNSKKSLPRNELNTAYFYWSQRKPIDNNGRSTLSLGW